MASTMTLLTRDLSSSIRRRDRELWDLNDPFHVTYLTAYAIQNAVMEGSLLFRRHRSRTYLPVKSLLSVSFTPLIQG
ncbi:hypothetical protein CC2G_003626 [Coprinopsis cinerea AmutBmut pab1-1]|nr:hypothetical protein CC2G_003626 [Coprinopsis cinerea AmutBmut pab1-1]